MANKAIAYVRVERSRDNTCAGVWTELLPAQERDDANAMLLPVRLTHRALERGVYRVVMEKVDDDGTC